MYKKQMILQRLVCYIVLIAAALVFVYSLGLMTDMFEMKFEYHAERYYKNGMTEEALSKVKVPGTEIYYNMQQFNRELTGAGIVLILLAVSQFIFQNQNRRKYYIANYITVAANTIGAIYYSWWGLSTILSYKEQYLKIDFAELQKLNERYNFAYTESTFWFDASKVVFGVVLAAMVLNLFNTVWKICLMNNEKKLVQSGKEGKAA